MKNLIKKLIIITIGTFFPYLLGSIYSASFNAANWSEDARVHVVVAMSLSFLVSLLVASEVKDSDNQYNEPISKKTLNGFSKYQDGSRVVSLEDYKNK